MARTKKEQNIEKLTPETETAAVAETPECVPEAETEILKTDSEAVSEETLATEENSPADAVAEETAEPISGAAEEPEAFEPKKTAAKRKKKTETADTAGEEEKPVEQKKAAKKRSAVKPISVISIDERRSVETEADKEKNDLIDLLESLRVGKILTGTIQGVERVSDNHSMAVIYHGAFKIVIPAEEAVTAPDDYRDKSPEDVMHYLLTKRLGAEVDFIVKGIDQEANVAVASRLNAMKAKRKQYYFGTDREGNNLLYAGQCAEARVVSVIRAGIFIDLFGLEVYIPLRELSYQRMMNATEYFRPGQRILVKILELVRTDRNNIKVTASVKQSAENPYEKALRRYVVDNRYVGTVSIVDTNGVFVALDGGVDCLCSYPKRGRPPRGARVTVRILGISRETNRIWGAITHIATPNYIYRRIIYEI